MICYECDGLGTVCSECFAPEGYCDCDYDTDASANICFNCDGMGEIDDDV